MDWTAANKQRQDALLRVFHMLVVMVLLIVRAGLDLRAAPAAFAEDTSSPDDALSSSSALCRAALYRNALTLLCAAKAVLRRLSGMDREIYELMNHAHTLALSLRGRILAPTQRREWTSERLDSS